MLIGLLIYSCNNEKKEEPVIEKKEVGIDSTLVTDSSWGLITAKTDFEGLKEIFGASNVIDERICGPECVDSIDVTIIYKETNKELIIHWKENKYHQLIGMIESYAAAPYHTKEHLKIGSTMRDLLKENGQPINFMGFSWDYGGGISNYNNGKLDGSNIRFRLDLKGESIDNSLLGDVELSTEMPNAKKNLDNMVVYQLYLFLNE